MGRTASTNTDTDSSGWGRVRLVTILTAGLLAALAFAVGLGFAAHYALRSTGQAEPTNGLAGQNAADRAPLVTVDPAGKVAAALGQAHRDQVAAAPMLTATAEDSRNGTPAATPGPFVQVPPATRTGPAQVPTGFTHTPAGAVGQLAAIEATVLQGMSIPQTNQVHQQWTLPAAPDVARWPLTANVQAFLATARQGQTKDPTVSVTAVPVAGQVKGTDGPDWVLACVLLDVRAVIKTDSRMAYGYCERMQWASGADGGRWMIAPGSSPATAPSTWPGTDLAIAAGWRTWTGPGEGTD
ncbi:MAG: hypothetical protein ABI692_09830 [Terracoccus sp.]